MRQIVFDTETTGLDAHRGDRIIEIGMVEIVDFLPTGKEFHRLINPMRLIPLDSQRVHGITDAMVADAPDFANADVVGALLEFIGDAPLVAHNAEFDRGFLNAEFDRLNLPKIEKSRCIDTLVLAKRKFPDAPSSLDALCKRFAIDLSSRVKHGALIDARLLASVYLELNGGAERRLDLYEEAGSNKEAQTILASATWPSHGQRSNVLAPRLHEEELAAHLAFVASLKNGGLWPEPHA